MESKEARELGKICREKLLEAVLNIATRTGGDDGMKTRCLILSGGVDTCAIAEAAKEAGVGFSCAITVLAGDPEAATDRPYASAIAKVRRFVPALFGF